MKHLNRLIPLLLLALLAGCSQLTGPSADAYLERNVSVWNSLIGKINQWSAGADAERLTAAMQERKGLAGLKSDLGNARQEAIGMRDAMKALKTPDDAAELHAKLVASLEESVSWYDAVFKLTDLPDGFSDAQAVPLLEAMDAAGTKVDELTTELDQLQDAYAKKHGISLHRNADPTAHAR